MKKIVVILIALATFTLGFFASYFILNRNNELIEIEAPPLRISFGENFHAEVNAMLNSNDPNDRIGFNDPFLGRTVSFSDYEDEWILSIEWRSAIHFFEHTNPPVDWTNTTQYERNRYFHDYLRSWGPHGEVENIAFTVELMGTQMGFAEQMGQIIRYVDDFGTWHTYAVVEHYSFSRHSMQDFGEGAFFIRFFNFATTDNRFVENEAIFEEFLSSVRLWRLYLD